MTAPDIAAALLKDVQRYTFDTNGELLYEREVLAALTAALDPALTERAGEVLQQWDDYVESMGSIMGDVERMAQRMRDLITALLAQNAALRAEREKEAKAHEKEIYVWSENYAGLERKLTAAEAQIATLTARVERLTGALYPLSVLPIGDRTADDVPLYGLDERYITHGDIRRARAELATEADNG